MNKSIYLKFLLGYVIFSTFSLLIIGFMLPNMLSNYLMNEEASALYEEAVYIADTYANKLYTNDISLETVQNQLDALQVFFQADFWILNPSGRMVLEAGADLDLSAVTMIEEFDPSLFLGNYYTTGTFFDYFNTEKLTVLAPITNNFEVNGYVVIHYDVAHVLNNSNDLQNIIFIVASIILLLSLILIIFFTSFIYFPIKHIVIASKHYADGNFHYELQPESNDEIGYLATIMSYMAKEISRVEDDQKKFVANVSHDFRSPLTSIRGYLEALLDGTIPPELHEKYISIVLNETNRLTKLTNGLLQLNNLNTKGLLLDQSVYDMNQIIRNTVASFEGTCDKKHIRIQLILTNDIMYVKADMSKIQQVLYNLLDNAIKFSHPYGKIKIETTEKKHKLYVSVKDYGVGIPKDEIKLVWDRFYKSDSSRGKDKTGTGLGLAITREIIHSHGEHINLISTQNAGSEFIFTLPIYESETETDEIL